MKAEKIILGIDPGTNVMGYGVLRVVDNKASLVVMGIIDMRKERDPYLRLGKIFDIHHDIPIHEYAPLKIKLSITGQGKASKEQVAEMLRRILNISDGDMPKFMDATDALGAAYCHYLQMGRPQSGARHYGSWKDFVAKNMDRVK